MAIFNASNTSKPIAINSYGDISTYFGIASYGEVAETVVNTSTKWVELGGSWQAIFTGTGLTYGASQWDSNVYRTDPTPNTGSFTSLTLLDINGDTTFTLTGLVGIKPTSTAPTVTTIFALADTITGGSGDDYLFAAAGNDVVNGGYGLDTLDGGTGNDTLNGGADDDRFAMANDGTDALDGGTGFDTVDYSTSSTGLGIKLALGAAGALTTATNSQGNDTVKNIEAIVGASGNDTLTGNELANFLDGRAGNDSLVGGSGNDTIEGGYGKDTLTGGTGFDYVYFGSSGSSITNFNIVTGALSILEGSGTQTETDAQFEGVVGTYGADTITGASNTNTAIGYHMDGANGKDKLTGGAGSDTLIGGSQDSAIDTLAGGAGNDLYRITYSPSSSDYSTYPYVTTPAGFDLVVEGASAGTDTVILDVTPYNYNNVSTYYTLANNVENLTVDAVDGSSYNYGTNVSAAGNSLANKITALDDWSITSQYGYYYGKAFKLYGAAGNDTISGWQGADTLVGGTGNDSMIGGEGNDTYYVDSTSDVIVELADEGEDWVVSTISYDISPTAKSNIENIRLAGDVALTAIGNALSNDLLGNGLNNTLTGNAGDDLIAGGAGNDTLRGGDGNDIVTGGSGNDSMDGGTGIDTLDFSNWAAALVVNLSTNAVAGAGTDTITGFENVTGGSMNDSLTGTTATNRLMGGKGNDYLSGGSGADDLNGDVGNDVINGGAGADIMTGGADKDSFIFNTPVEATLSDRIMDFKSDEDIINFDMSSFAKIGDGDTLVEGAVRWGYTGGYSKAAELVVFTKNIPTSGYYDYGTWDVNVVATGVGNASSAYAAGDKRIFVVDNGSQTGLFQFTSAAADATVFGTELKLIATLNSVQNTQLADYGFIA